MSRNAGFALASVVASAVLVAQPPPQGESKEASGVRLQNTIEQTRKEAEAGDAKRQAILAFYYHLGLGVKKDDVEAARWYRKSAEQGNAGAQFQLGAIYAEGTGIQQDYSEAAQWFGRAAEQGLAISQDRLAGLYYDGKGVPQDYAQAANWYRKAAEQGDAGAQIGLSDLYERGRGVPQDYVEAHMWINLAASQLPDSSPFLGGDVRTGVVNIRDGLAAKMTAAQIAEAQSRAREWKVSKQAAPLQ